MKGESRVDVLLGDSFFALHDRVLNFNTKRIGVVALPPGPYPGPPGTVPVRFSDGPGLVEWIDWRSLQKRPHIFEESAAPPTAPAAPIFALHQRVRMKELDGVGRIVAKFEDSSGVQFRVRYFHNGDEKAVYFFADEIEAIAENRP